MRLIAGAGAAAMIGGNILSDINYTAPIVGDGQIRARARLDEIKNSHGPIENVETRQQRRAKARKQPRQD